MGFQTVIAGYGFYEIDAHCLRKKKKEKSGSVRENQRGKDAEGKQGERKMRPGR